LGRYRYLGKVQIIIDQWLSQSYIPWLTVPQPTEDRKRLRSWQVIRGYFNVRGDITLPPPWPEHYPSRVEAKLEY